MFLNKQQQAAPKLEREVGMPGAAADQALAATREHTGRAFGATASSSFSAPHSSASTCEKANSSACSAPTAPARRP